MYHMLTDDEWFVKRAFRAASRAGRMFADDDTITFRSFAMATVPKVSNHFHEQVRYWELRLAGQSHNMAEILATRGFPAVRTDATYNRGRVNGNQFEKTPGQGDHYRAIAEAAGVSTTGKYYSAGLADFPGDPMAWVSDRGDVLRVAREKGFKVTGAVEYDPGEREPVSDAPIDPDVVSFHVDRYMGLDPGERRADVEERVTDALSGKVDLNPVIYEE